MNPALHEASQPSTSPAAGSVSLSQDWGVIRAVGADAASFLQGQLTQDVAVLDVSKATLAGYCSAKGRLIASFIVWRPSADEFFLACSQDVLAPTLKRLSMFVMRAKCALSDVSMLQAPMGVFGTALPPSIRDLAPMHVHEGWLRLPDAAGVARAWRLASDVAAPAPSPTALDDWRWLEVCSGVPRVTAATVDAFVPQMVNLELAGGVSFSKGCYPGQEVVARSQYRGTLKRRMHLFKAADAAQAGQEVFHSSDPAQPAGTVVLAASRQGGSAPHAALVSLKSALLEADGTWHLGSAEGALLEQLALPYEVARLAEA